MTLKWDNAIWLAARQMRDIWTSYIFSAIYFGLLGLVLAADAAWSAEFALPILMFILVQPSISTRYMSFKPDNEVTRHQEFLRVLPIGYGTVIFARVIAMLVAGIINAPLFFLPFWYVGPEWSAFSHYLAWCTFWIGLAFVGSALALVQEFGLPFQKWVKINAITVVVVIVGLILLVWLADIRPYAQTVELSGEHPWIMAIAGVVIGLTAMWLGMVAAVRGFRRREFAR